jgi:hypothetical protein
MTPRPFKTNTWAVDMNLRALLTTIALLLLGSGAALELCAQDPQGGDRRGHGHRHEGRGREGRGWGGRRGFSAEERAQREALRDRAQAAFRRLAANGATNKVTRRFDRMAGQSAFRISEEERKRWAELGDADLVRAVVKGWLAEQRRRDDWLLERLGAEAAEAVKGLEGEARHRKIIELQSAALLERTIEKAARQGMVSNEEASALRALPTDDKMEAVRSLQRRMILFVHRDEIPAAERARLEKLPASAFFRDPTVRRLRFGPQLDRKQLRELEGLGEKERRALVDALASEESDQALRDLGFLDQKMRDALLAMKPESRRRFARMAKRMLFRRHHLYRPRRELFGQLDEADRRRFMELDQDEARFAFLEEHFPKEDWKRVRRSWSAREEIRGLVPKQWHLVRAIERAETARLPALLERAGLDAKAIARIVELHPDLIPSARGGRGRGPRGGGVRGERRKGRDRPDFKRGGSNRIRKLMERLDPEEKAEFEKIGDPRQRMEWLRKRFPQDFEERRRGPGKR